jgi:hypothetical protein
VAKKLEVTTNHVADLIDEGQLEVLDVSGANNKTGRRCLRIPIESYLQFVSKRLSLAGAAESVPADRIISAATITQKRRIP